MAIAFDAASGSTGFVVTSLTWSHTCTGANLILWVAVVATGEGDDISSVTYNGVGLTRAGTDGFASSRLDLWYLISPATGTHDIVITSSNFETDLHGCAASYTGAAQSGVPDATGVGGNVVVTSATVSTTTSADNCWVILAAIDGYNNLDIVAGTGSTLRNTQGGGGPGERSAGILDSNGPVTPAGSYAMTFSVGGATGNMRGVTASFAPAGGGGGFIDNTSPILRHIYGSAL